MPNKARQVLNSRYALGPGSPRQRLSGLVLLGFVLIDAVFLLTVTACRSSALVITAAPLPAVTSSAPAATPGVILVTVDGAVNNPGNYTLPPDSLVDDALHAADGPAPGADLERINLAAALRDGDHIHVPHLGEVLPTPTPFGLDADGRIDINLADAALLETLPGIGPAIGQRIVEYREMNGPFRTVEEIQEVSGIGLAKFGGIRGSITVGELP